MVKLTNYLLQDVYLKDINLTEKEMTNVESFSELEIYQTIKIFGKRL